ncbi:hypothetical protein HMI01_06770 [Halolactibacillus miurensis]|uniref:Uncharacterized protein n=1 Tax=Halolactibacillus miurensis TaxID=306541 RepID=A0A1I6PQS6_9BACI|nr:MULTISPECIES: hypothetical protein [Halolactibacillus]GEM03689.1 hypothetical protein HMI01_06770 [Halolactibacillus miurensis]SFS42557.1 hypothetical protein SAMN05421668_102141 [Halolactibacillus miurensis]
MKRKSIIILSSIIICLLIIDENLPKMNDPSTSYYPPPSASYQVKIKYVHDVSDILVTLYELNGTASQITIKGIEVFQDINNLENLTRIPLQCYYYFPQFKKPEAHAPDLISLYFTS